MENFDDFFDNQYKQDNNEPNYHTPDKKTPHKTNKQQVTIICLSVLIVIMVIAMIVNAIVLSTMQDKISNDYIASMKADMEESYKEAIDKELQDKEILEDLKNSAIEQLQHTVGELAREKCWDSTVEITSTNSAGNTSIGSGFLIERNLGDFDPSVNGKDFYIITNAHVVSEPTGNNLSNPQYALNRNIKCVFPKQNDKQPVYSLQVLYHGTYREKVGTFPGYQEQYYMPVANCPDLAILKFADIKPSVSEHKPIEFSNAKVVEGDPLAIIGSPQGIGHSISTGAVSKTNIVFGTEGISDGKFLMTDAAINGGNSGGPVLDKTGKLIGVVESKIVKQSVEAMGFAISIDTLNFFLDNLNLQYH